MKKYNELLFEFISNLERDGNLPLEDYRTSNKLLNKNNALFAKISEMGKSDDLINILLLQQDPYVVSWGARLLANEKHDYKKSMEIWQLLQRKNITNNSHLTYKACQRFIEQLTQKLAEQEKNGLK